MTPTATSARAVVLLRGTELLDPDTLEMLAQLHPDCIWRTPQGIPIDALEKPVMPVRAQVTSDALRAHHAAMDAAWLHETLEILREIALRQETISADDLWQHMLSPPRDPRTGMSTLMLAAERGGMIAKTSDTRPTIRQRSGGRRVRVWRSLLYQPR